MLTFSDFKPRVYSQGSVVSCVTFYHDRLTSVHMISYGKGRHKLAAHSPQSFPPHAPRSEFLCTTALFLPWASLQANSELKTFSKSSVKDFQELSVAEFEPSAFPKPSREVKPVEECSNMAKGGQGRAPTVVGTAPNRP